MGHRKELKSVLTDNMDECILCGKPREQIHHIFTAYNRKKAEKFGYVIPLCREHHTGDMGVHSNREIDVCWRQEAQKHFEKHHGSREDFIKEFGKSWI